MDLSESGGGELEAGGDDEVVVVLAEAEVQVDLGVDAVEICAGWDLWAREDGTIRS